MLQALTRSSKADARQEAVKAKLLELEEKERKRLADAQLVCLLYHASII